MSVRALVPTVGPAHESIAVRALATEGFPFDAVNVSGNPFAYGLLLFTHLDDRDGLLVVEHDVVPPPGHLDGMVGCDSDWCVSPFPFAPNAVKAALGCLRVSGGLARRVRKDAKEWCVTPWNQLDAAVWRVLINKGGSACQHAPVAHCKPQPAREESER